MATSKKKMILRDYAIKNKIGNRDSGRPVKAVSTEELQKILVEIKTTESRYNRDRNKVEVELNRRGFDVTTIG